MINKYSLLYVICILGFLGGCSTKPSVVENPSGENSRYPFLSSTGKTLYMSWISSPQSNKNYSLNYSRFEGGKWSQTATIASDSSWFVNWADFPSILPGSRGPIAAHWLNKQTGGPYAYNINIALADTAGRWLKPFRPHLDSTATEHGFVSMIPWKEQSILAVWLDGRQTANRAEDEYFNNMAESMTLRGAIIGRDGAIQEKFLIDDTVCDCCQTSLIKTDNGALVAYRNRTGKEVRDIYISRFDSTGWSAPQAIHDDGWTIGACPVNGPKLAASGSDIAIAWHTAADKNPAAKVAISKDGGYNFSEPVTVNQQSSMGRLDLAMYEGKAYVSWIERSGGNGADLKLTSVDKNLTVTEPVVIDSIGGSRRSGFPQMEVLNNRLIFAWTDIDSSTRIRTMQYPLP